MIIETLVVGAYEVNCYLLNGGERAALAIDPGHEAERIRAQLHSRGWDLAAVLLTHGHADHLCGLGGLLGGARPPPVYLHAQDARWAFSERNRIALDYEGLAAPPATLQPVTDGQTLELGGLTCRVIATPGHSPGGVCYYFPEPAALFSGDTLFQGTVGRTDLPGGDGRMLAASLRQLARLPDATRVYPGHGPATTLAEEKRSNFFFRTPAG